MSVHKPHDRMLIAEGAASLARILQDVISRVVIGATGSELTVYAETLIRRAGGEPAFKGYGTPPYPHAMCVSVNDCVVHGIPNDRLLKAGDLVGCDLGMIYHGFYSDMARTVALEPVSDRERELLQTAQDALDRAIALIKPGITTGDVGAAIQELVESRGFGVVRDLAGHGVGRSLHEPPEMPNFGEPGTGTKLTEGMVLAIEPMITLGDWRVTVGEDAWSVVTKDGSKTAHVEDMIEVTKYGCRVLTRGV